MTHRRNWKLYTFVDDDLDTGEKPMTYYIVGWPKILSTASADEAQNPASQVSVIQQGLYYITYGSLTWVTHLRVFFDNVQE